MLSFPIKPMLLQSTAKPFNSPDHLFEWKVDGIRCIMFYEHGKVKLQSKTGKDCTRQFPELWVPQIDSNEAIIDGEITILTWGKPDFEAVMERYLAGSKKIQLLLETKPAVYVVWDIAWLNGKQLTGLPLIERKQLLNQVVGNSEAIRKIDWVDNDGLNLWKAILAQDLEGMVAKRQNSRYMIGQRSAAWVKIKNYREAEVNVFGYSKKDSSILVGTGKMVQGHAIGMQLTERVIMRELLEKYGSEKGNAIYLPHGIRGRVKFTTLTPRGNMRDCSWVKFEI